MKKRNLLILSHKGFIGKSLFNYFLNNNNYNVQGLGSDECNLLDKNLCEKILRPKIKKKTTVIFLSSYLRNISDNVSILKNNISLISNFLESVNKKYIEQFIYFSSTCIYGRPPKSLPINENSNIINNNFYGLSKNVSEDILSLYLDCPLSIIRIPGVYGVFDKNSAEQVSTSL